MQARPDKSNKRDLTKATMAGTRTGVVSLTTAKGKVRVNMEKKRDVCREYESGSGEHLIFSHSATMSESALILVSICCHTRSSCKHARERQHMQERESSNQTNGQEKIKRKWVREERREGGRGGAVREKNNAYGECERERACAR